MTKGRVVTHVGVVKESSKMIKDREIAKEGKEWNEQPRYQERSIDRRAVRQRTRNGTRPKKTGS